MNLLRPTTLLLFLAAAARAQENLWTAYGLPNDFQGGAVAGGSDFNGDGVADIVTGGVLNTGPGVVRVLSGADGSLLYELLGEKKFDQFGIAVANFPDLDGDGVGDFLVGARFSDWKDVDAGSAYLFSGRDGSLLQTFRGQLVGARFGERVANVGDLDGDQLPDLAISAPLDWSTGSDTGAVYLFSSADGSLIRRLDGTGPTNVSQPFFGSALAAAGDVDGDGVPDVLVGAPYHSELVDRGGSATLFSGADGSVLWHLASSQPIATFGSSVAGGGDLDHDGHADFLVGAALEDLDVSNPDRGRVYVYSGRTFTTFWTHVGGAFNDRLGLSAAGAGDVNHDGFDDYLIGDLSDVNGTNCGAARLFSGVNGRMLFRFDGAAANDEFGSGLGAAGDLDGDGLLESIVGAPLNDGNGNACGSTSVFRGNDLYLQADPLRPPPGQTVTFSTRGGLAGAYSILVIVAVDGIPVFEPIATAYLDGFGEAAASFVIPADAAGHSYTLVDFAQRVPRRPHFSDSGRVTITVP